ncbi:hypothetical protein P5V34_04625 [Mycobacteroides abscessus subsp. abscessus]|jgi:type IV secretion system protein VirD4|uniref:hypothetical protein n=1 Tax=Mycobacteroides abscessus TaxID=36809 RepID=UPI00266D07CD|nr:hypothetical protein [Mycobacteroides abscessus]MDO3013271.1 hypothetical protein [Mycobacteroides abscessus subsp. abscessus]
MTTIDPTRRIVTPTAALDLAARLLSLTHPDLSHAIWCDIAVVPLAAALYAASPQGNSLGMTWVRALLDREDLAAATDVTDALSRDTVGANYLAEAWLRAFTMAPPQAESIRKVIREAIGGPVGAAA